MNKEDVLQNHTITLRTLTDENEKCIGYRCQAQNHDDQHPFYTDEYPSELDKTIYGSYVERGYLLGKPNMSQKEFAKRAFLFDLFNKKLKPRVSFFDQSINFDDWYTEIE